MVRAAGRATGKCNGKVEQQDSGGESSGNSNGESDGELREWRWQNGRQVGRAEACHAAAAKLDGQLY